MIVFSVNRYLTVSIVFDIVGPMARLVPSGTGAWNFRGIPRDLMRKVKMAAAHEGKTVKDFLIELAEARIAELEKRGILPKGR
jgi:hypothetical protein